MGSSIIGQTLVATAGVSWRDGVVVALVGIGILVAKDYPTPRFRYLGTPPDEQAALFLQTRFAPNTVVSAYAPGNVWIANMQYAQLSINIRASSQEQFLAWLATTQVKAIYVDDRLRRNEPAIWSLIQESDERLVEAFNQGSVQIFMVKDQP
ncbi:MAG: hypothetical protein H0T53_10730 [Herpetosiphonaceae bacterium]|nr:hypothetical protein [Herpetosiphonaceae bacterium]